MSRTHFPSGFRGGVSIRNIPLLTTLSERARVFHVHSVTGSNNNDGSATRPLASIEGAFNNTRLTANNGDMIMVMPGHVETVSAAAGLDMDVAGVTIWFLGNGNDRGRITFGTAVGADMDVDAADITMVNPRFTAAIDALTGPIDVNAARFKMFNATWEDGTTINTTDCVVADANADNMEIDGFTFIDGNAAGTAKQSFVQVAGATGVILRNIYADGAFGTGIIENGTAWIQALVEDCVINNTAAGPVVGMLLQATSTGWIKGCHVRVVSGSTYITANNDMQIAESFGYSTDASAGEKMGTILAGDVEGKVDLLSDYLQGANGIPTWPTAAAPANAVSLAEALRYISEQQSVRYVTKTAAVLTNGLDLFTVTGTVRVIALYLLCATVNDGTASTIQFNAVPTVGGATTLSGASASVANAAAGATITLAGTALATAALYGANGPNLIANPGTILVPAGVIDVVVAVGSTTGTWSAHLVYEPLSSGASVASA